MLALWSFGSEAASILGAEQFAGFYLSAGLASALASQLGRRRATGGGYSLGASGAVYGCFALTAMTRPDAEVSLTSHYLIKSLEPDMIRERRDFSWYRVSLQS